MGRYRRCRYDRGKISMGKLSSHSFGASKSSLIENVEAHTVAHAEMVEP